MQVTLSDDMAEFVATLVAPGHYESADEVVRAALCLHRENESSDAFKLAMLRASVAEGIASLDRGEGILGDGVMARLRARFTERATTSSRQRPMPN